MRKQANFFFKVPPKRVISKLSPQLPLKMGDLQKKVLHSQFALILPFRLGDLQKSLKTNNLQDKAE